MYSNIVSHYFNLKSATLSYAMNSMNTFSIRTSNWNNFRIMVGCFAPESWL